MPLYTVIILDGTVSIETKAKIAEEITRIHTSAMKVPKNSARVVFFSYSKGSGFTGGEKAFTAALNCVLQSGPSLEEKQICSSSFGKYFRASPGSLRINSRFHFKRSHQAKPWRWARSCKRSGTNSSCSN